MPAPIGARLLRHEQDHDAVVARRIAGIRLLAQLPLADHRERDIAGGAVADVGKGHDRDVAPRLRPHRRRDPEQRLLGLRAEDVGEVVDESRRLRKLQRLRSLQGENQPDSLQRVMPHRRVDLLAFARRQPSRTLLRVVAVLAIVAGCRGESANTTAGALDTSSARDRLEVGARPSGPAAALEDSAAALDASFQQERDALNAEARALDSLDRRSPEYGRRFTAWRLRAIAAESLRARRDRLRTRVVPRP